jgi:hypothetical protein
VLKDGARKFKRGVVFSFLAGAGVLTACQLFNPNYQAKTSKDIEVRLISDSSQVRGLISSQTALQTDERASIRRFLDDEATFLRRNDGRELDRILQHPEIYVPVRIAFLDAMANVPAAVVQRGSYCRILQGSLVITVAW